MSSTAYAAAVLADSPWGFWKCEEASGTTLADSSGNARSMTVNGSGVALAQTGPDGVSADSVLWGDSSGATENYGQTPATIGSSFATLEAWFYLAATPTHHTVLLGGSVVYGSNTYDKVLYVDSAGKLNLYCYTGSATFIPTPSAVTLNAWHHVVASVGAAGVKIRVDATTVATNAATTSYAGSQCVFIHGSGNDGGANNFTNASAIRVGPAALWISQLTDAQTDAHRAAMLVPATQSGEWSIM